MNIKEAYSILEIPQTSTPEEAKKKYRELTKKHHPDVNKEAGAEDKFKKINEAYQVVSSGKSTDREEQAGAQWHDGGFSPFNPFGHTARQHIVYKQNIELSTTISFKEAVLGCKKNLTFDRDAKCQDCAGQGEIPLNNGCEKCGGQGRTINRRGGMVFIQTCDKCLGRAQVTPCTTCQSTGSVSASADISVNIPGGRNSGDILRLSGMGHYAGNFGPMEQHTDAFLHITVAPEPGLKLEGNDVTSVVEISLAEAIKGCRKTTNTIDGYKDIEVKSLSRNKDEILIPKLGVNGTGNHRAILDVKYPSDTQELIKFLTQKEK